MSARTADSLHGLLSMGLFVCHDDASVSYERNIMRSTAALLKAVAMAQTFGDDGQLHNPGPCGRMFEAEKFDEHDTTAALAAIAAILQYGPAAIDHLEDLNGTATACTLGGQK